MDQAIAGQQPAPCCCHADHLTDRELDVLCQLAAGLTNHQAAAAINVSSHTIAGHLRTMLARTSARNRAALVARAYAARLAPTARDRPRPAPAVSRRRS